MENMRNGLETGKTYVFNKPMIYKMVGTLAQFDPNYRALDEIVLDSSAMEASSIANFSAIKKEGRFHTNPAYIDALSQSAGFVMNANDRSNLEIEVFVNHGWKSFQLFEELSPQKRYQTHVAMQEKSGKLWKGDILILDGEKVVASFKGIAVSPFILRPLLKENFHLPLVLMLGGY
jgi:Polyketide synthase dehydratase